MLKKSWFNVSESVLLSDLTIVCMVVWWGVAAGYARGGNYLKTREPKQQKNNYQPNVTCNPFIKSLIL